MKALVNGKLVLKDRIEENKTIIFDERIKAVQEDISGISGLEIIDAKGAYVSPGFIDIHIHGGFGSDVMDGSPASLDKISRGLVESGVTGYLPTTMSMSWDKIDMALRNIRACKESRRTGARILGAHLEGPFINPERKGAHDEANITKPDFEKIKGFLDIIKVITIAPELDENLDFIRKLSSHKHISLSIGHSDASYEEAIAAIKAGIKSSTHLYNAMSGLNHRSPGAVGAALNSDIYCELIADKIHVHPAMFKIAAAVKGSERIILITDAIRASGAGEGVYELGGQEVTVKSGSARLADGTLAGSILRLNQAVRNFREHTELSLQEIVSMVSLNPAKLLGLDNEIGSIEEGKKANFTIFNEQIEVLATIIDGETCFSQI